MAGWITDLYPGGSKQVWGPGLAFKQPPCKLVLHTTETKGYPDYRYDGKKREPNLTVNVPARTWRQHVSLDQGAYALQASTVSTNTMGAIQVELIGYAASMKNTSGEDLEWLLGLLKVICQQANIPIQSTVSFIGSEAYGTDGPVRLSSAAWTAYRGILGHQHVPTNSHWDPGALPIQAWVSKMNSQTPEPQPEPEPEPVKEDEMASLVGIIFDVGEGDGFGSTAIYNETIGWVQTSGGLGPRDSYYAYCAIGDALGFVRREVRVNRDGWILSQLFKNPSSDVDVIVDVETLAQRLSALLPSGGTITPEQIQQIAEAVNNEAHDRLAG